jgi:hypothetical protein
MPNAVFVQSRIRRPARHCFVNSIGTGAAVCSESVQLVARLWFNAAMAKQTVVTEVLIDDLDGSVGERTVTFMWDGIAYEIELSKKNAATFEKALKPYVDAGRRIRDGRGRRASGRRSGKRDLSDIRDWAKKNGFEVSTRGRIASSVIDAYKAANK